MELEREGRVPLAGGCSTVGSPDPGWLRGGLLDQDLGFSGVS